MNYHEAGFDGRLADESVSNIMRRLGLNPLSQRHGAERNEIMRGWHDADQLDRATRPAKELR